MKQFLPLDKALRLGSQRLYLRPITIEDTDMVLSWRNSEYVRNNFFYRLPISKEEHIKWVTEKCDKGLVFQFVVVEKETDLPIGCVYLQRYNPEDDSLESGVFFSEGAPKGKGYATEAVKIMNEFAFSTLKVSKTIAEVISTNEASMKLHKKAGFEVLSNSLGTIIPTGEKVEKTTFVMNSSP